jgi:hypothetical protein
MRLGEIYELAIEIGIENDPRGKDKVKEILKRNEEEYRNLKEKEKKFYDSERLKNPYSDTRILAGSEDLEVTGIMSGIDLEVPEVLLADRLNQKGEKINLLLAHHPEGSALAGLSEVMRMQADIWHDLGVPINIGDVLIDGRMKEVARTLMPLNHERAIDAAKILGFGFLAVHTPADNLVTKYVQNLIDKEKPTYVKEVIDILYGIPEYEEAVKRKAGPTILVGDGNRRAGKIVVDMTGGTEGPEGVFEKLADAGVGTLVQMHLGDKLRKKAEEHHINVIIAGHVASDAIGLNLFLDNLEKKGLRIIPCSGLTRVSRVR